MDEGKSFGHKTLSRAPIERIQEIQKEMQANLKKAGLIHLIGRHDRITSVLIPGMLMVAAVPMVGYSLYMLSTQNAPNN